MDRWHGGPDSTTGGQEIADQFVLARAASVNRVTWFGAYNFTNPWVTGDTVAFQIRVFADGGNVPAMPPVASAAVSAVAHDTGDGYYGTHVYLFDAATSVDLGAGTTYWLSVTESDPRTEFDRMTWDTALLGTGIPGSAVRYAYPEVTTPWAFVNDQEGNERSSMAFAVYGSQVPEPSSIVMLAMAGLIALFRSLRR